MLKELQFMPHLLLYIFPVINEWWWNCSSVNIYMKVMNTSVEPRKNLSPDRIWTHDLPNTGQTLYPLSYENSRRARSFNWALTWLFSRSHARVHYFHIYIFPVVWSYIRKTPTVKCRSIPSIKTQWILHQHFIGTLVDTQSTLHQHLGLIFNWCI